MRKLLYPLLIVGLPSTFASSISQKSVPDPWLVPIASISANHGSGTVSVTTLSPHRLVTGQVVNISGVYDSTQTTPQLRNTIYNTFGGNGVLANRGIDGGVTVTVDSPTSFHYAATVNSGTVSAAGQTGYVVNRPSPVLNQVFTDPSFGSRTVRATCRELIEATWPADSACGPAGPNPFGTFSSSGNNTAFNWMANSNAGVSSWGIYCPSSGVACTHPGKYNFYVEGYGGFIIIETLDPVSMQVRPYRWADLGFTTACPISGGAPWSQVDPDVLYYPSGNSISICNVRTGPPQSTAFNILTDCGPGTGPPGFGRKASGAAQAFISAGDQYLAMAGGSVNPGGPEEIPGQQYFNYNFVYDTSQGTCTWYNLNTSRYGTYNSSSGTAMGPFNITDSRTGQPLAQTQAPSSPGAFATTGGALPKATYYVQITYTQKYSGTTHPAYGESLPSPEQAVALSGAYTALAVTSPPATPLLDSSCGGEQGCAYDQVVATGYKVYLSTSSGGELDVTPLVFGPHLTFTATNTGGALATGNYNVKVSYLLNENGSTQEESDGSSYPLQSGNYPNCVAVTGPTGSIFVPEPPQVPTEVGWKIYAAANSGACTSAPVNTSYFLVNTYAVGAGRQRVGSIPISGANPLTISQNQTGPISLGTNWVTPSSWRTVPTGSYGIGVFYNAQHSSGTDQTPGHSPTIGTSGYTAHGCGGGGSGGLFPGCAGAGSTSPTNVSGYPATLFAVTWHYGTDPSKAEMCNGSQGPDGTVRTGCAGHPVAGYNYRMMNNSTSGEPYNFYRQSMAELADTTLISSPPSPATSSEDMHQGGTFTDSDNTPFLFDGESTVGDDSSCTPRCSPSYKSGWALKARRAWDNEVVLCSTDGSKLCRRYAKDHGGSYGSILSKAGWVSSTWGVAVLPICNPSQDMQYALCQSDWYGTIPSLNGQVPSTTNLPGMDMFIYELK